MKDPSSLPLAISMVPEHKIRDMVRVHLPSLIKNKAVKNLFDFKAEDQKKLLTNDLVGMRLFNPRLVNKLYSLSNFGLQEKYLSKFSGARSIQQATISAWKNEAEVIASIKAIEEASSANMQCHTRCDSGNTPLYSIDTCMTGLAQSMRDEMWGIDIKMYNYAFSARTDGMVLYK